jgi:hypothetical protein
LNDDKKHSAEEKICRTEKPADFERRQETQSRGEKIIRGQNTCAFRSDLDLKSNGAEAAAAAAAADAFQAP